MSLIAQEFIKIVFTGKPLTYIDVNLKIWQSVEHDLHDLHVKGANLQSQNQCNN